MKDKKERISEIIDKIHEIPISDILSTKMQLFYSGGQHKGLCPFHDDKTIGSFVVTNKKGLFKCFSCGAGGDAIKFVSTQEGKNYVQASLSIAVGVGMISERDYETLSKRKFDTKTLSLYEKKSLEKKSANLIADEVALNFVYSIFKKGPQLSHSQALSLSTEHRHLLLSRGLTDEDIEEFGYFTMPNRCAIKGIKAALRKRGQDEDALLGVPGFYQDIASNKVTFIPLKGIGIPIRNAKRQIVGIQIRRDEKKEGEQRYRWFSSSFAGVDNGDKFEGGTSPGSPLDVIYPKEIMNKTVFITEGHFKALQLAKHFGCISISVQGATSWRNVSDTLNEIAAVHPVRYVYIAFDADMAYNFAVSIQSRKMGDDIQKKTEAKVVYVQWDSDLGKGIDDMIKNGHKSSLLKCNKEQYDIIYDEFIAYMYESFKIINEEKNIQKAFSSIAEKEIKAVYDSFVLSRMTQTKKTESLKRL